jgi:hypothetical protein
LLDVPGVAERQLEGVLEHVPHRLPVHAGGFHGHVRDLVCLKPIAQRDQPADSCGELGQVLLTPAIRRRHPHARGHLRLMHIEPGDPFKDRLHPRLLRFEISNARP